MDKKILKEFDVKLLNEKITEFEKCLLNVRLQSASTQVKNVKQLRELRLNIARAKTFLRQRQVEGLLKKS